MVSKFTFVVIFNVFMPYVSCIVVSLSATVTSADISTASQYNTLLLLKLGYTPSEKYFTAPALISLFVFKNLILEFVSFKPKFHINAYDILDDVVSLHSASVASAYKH